MNLLFIVKRVYFKMLLKMNEVKFNVFDHLLFEIYRLFIYLESELSKSKEKLIVYKDH